MADETAVSVLKGIRNDSSLAGVPVLVYTNHRPDPEGERILRANVGTRPLEILSSLDELRERIVLHLTTEQVGDALTLVRPEDAEKAAPLELDDRLAGRTVLVVDDDTRNLYALTNILELHGMRVLRADNGRRGIEVLLKHRDVDLILMDVMMPEMDGYAATAEIRAMPDYGTLPIIAVTAKAMPGDREKSLASGASDHVTKPVDAHDLITCVQRWLER